MSNVNEGRTHPAGSITIGGKDLRNPHHPKRKNVGTHLLAIGTILEILGWMETHGKFEKMAWAYFDVHFHKKSHSVQHRYIMIHIFQLEKKEPTSSSTLKFKAITKTRRQLSRRTFLARYLILFLIQSNFKQYYFEVDWFGIQISVKLARRILDRSHFLGMWKEEKVPTR